MVHYVFQVCHIPIKWHKSNSPWGSSASSSFGCSCTIAGSFGTSFPTKIGKPDMDFVFDLGGFLCSLHDSMSREFVMNLWLVSKVFFEFIFRKFLKWSNLMSVYFSNGWHGWLKKTPTSVLVVDIAITDIARDLAHFIYVYKKFSLTTNKHRLSATPIPPSLWGIIYDCTLWESGS